MSRRAWIYIWSILLAWLALCALTLLDFKPDVGQLLVFSLLTVVATLAQLFKVEAPSNTHTLYHTAPIFIFAGVILLDPFLFMAAVVITLLIEWAKERLTGGEHLRNWYLQPFNIAMYGIAGYCAHLIYKLLGAETAQFRTFGWMLSAVAAAVAYVVINHIILGTALVLARGKSWRESAALDKDNLLSELILLCLGAVVGALWVFNPWLIPLALSPLLLVHQALMIPKLKQEAQTDAKTGLLNARHFNKLFAEELERAKRFNRPLAVIMADLDLLRDINNTHGHLAGDAVISGMGQIIRDTIREYDIAARFGGEEYAIILLETETAKAQATAERLRARVEAAAFSVPTLSAPLRATMSLGVACFPNDALTTTQLIHVADLAVYQAKSAGRNRVVSAGDLPEAQDPDDRLPTS